MQLESLVSAEWLSEHLQDVAVIDGSYYLAVMGKDADIEFERGHIPGAQRWNIDLIADSTSPLKHMMPSAERIAEEAGLRGIDAETPVVIYDQLGQFSAARVWLAFKSIGHGPVALLDGGLPAWSAALEHGVARSVSEVDYGQYSKQQTTISREAVLDAVEAEDGFIIDARAAARFDGEAAEPVAGLLGGHMPGAINIPFAEVLDENHRFRDVETLRVIFDRHGISADKPVITSCGSGVTASIITFALAQLEIESLVYDGSWSEWGQAELNLPVVTSKSG